MGQTLAGCECGQENGPPEGLFATIDDTAEMKKLSAEMAEREDQTKPVGEDEELPCPYNEATTAVGDHVCERLGGEAVEEFNVKEVLKACLTNCKDDLSRGFDVDIDALAHELMTNETHEYCVAISDPTAQDCPLVYVSPGFEYLTGYRSSFCNGRSCRFLQPTCKILNDFINIGDRKEMREFCMEPQETGKIIVNMLLNERTDGTRFWNLLKMMYVDVTGSGRQYIVAMQATVDAFMPKVLQQKSDDEATNKKIVSLLEPFLFKLNAFRCLLKSMSSSSFTQLWAMATEEMEKIGKLETRPTMEAAAKAKAKAKAKAAAQEKAKAKAKASGKKKAVAKVP